MLLGNAAPVEAAAPLQEELHRGFYRINSWKLTQISSILILPAFWMDRRQRTISWIDTAVYTAIAVLPTEYPKDSLCP